MAFVLSVHVPKRDVFADCERPVVCQVILPVQRVFTAPEFVAALKNAVPAVAKIIDEDGGHLKVRTLLFLSGSCVRLETLAIDRRLCRALV